jgi:hypothetical protein
VTLRKLSCWQSWCLDGGAAELGSGQAEVAPTGSNEPEQTCKFAVRKTAGAVDDGALVRVLGEVEGRLFLHAQTKQILAVVIFCEGQWSVDNLDVDVKDIFCIAHITVTVTDVAHTIDFKEASW